MKKKLLQRIITATLTGAIMLAGMAGCSKTDTSGGEQGGNKSTTDGKKEGKMVIAMLPKFKGEN